MLKILLITIIMLGLAFLGLGIKLLLDKKAEFSPDCSSANSKLKDKGVSCGCGAGNCANE